MFWINSIGSRQLSYWSYKGENYINFFFFFFNFFSFELFMNDHHFLSMSFYAVIETNTNHPNYIPFQKCFLHAPNPIERKQFVDRINPACNTTTNFPIVHYWILNTHKNSQQYSHVFVLSTYFCEISTLSTLNSWFPTKRSYAHNILVIWFKNTILFLNN